MCKEAHGKETGHVPFFYKAVCFAVFTAISLKERNWL